MKNCAILVNSCDKYEDAWEPFFKLFNTYWNNIPYDIYLSTETKKFECSFLNIKTINSNPTLSWSTRLKNALNHINTDFVLFFLEDFFLMSQVNEIIFSSALELMESDKKIGAVCFNPDVDSRAWITKGTINNYFTVLTKKSKYRVNAVAALWRKDFLLSLLKDGESHWEFEINGNIRAKLKPQKILCVLPSYPKVFDFHLFIKYGYGISKQSWLPKNKELFEKHNITVNYDNLGWYKPEPKRKKRTLKEKIQLIFKNPKELIEMIVTKIKQHL